VVSGDASSPHCRRLRARPRFLRSGPDSFVLNGFQRRQPESPSGDRLMTIHWYAVNCLALEGDVIKALLPAGLLGLYAGSVPLPEQVEARKL